MCASMHVAQRFTAPRKPGPAGQVLFSNAGPGPSANGLWAGHLRELDDFGRPEPGGGAGAVLPRMQLVYKAPVVHPVQSWICATNDWGAVILPDGAVLALFRNGGRHCAAGSYPGWPAERLGLMRASCWNCTDYTLVTPTPLFQGLRSGASNEDAFLWWSHRGLHMVLHSQDPSDPVHAPHQTRGTVAFSPDTTTFDPASWVLSPTPAYGSAIPLRNGSILTARRRQRPQLTFLAGPVDPAPDGAWPRRTITHLSNNVDLSYGANDDGWGDSWALLLPLRQAGPPPMLRESLHDQN